MNAEEAALKLLKQAIDRHFNNRYICSTNLIPSVYNVTPEHYILELWAINPNSAEVPTYIQKRLLIEGVKITYVDEFEKPSWTLTGPGQLPAIEDIPKIFCIADPEFPEQIIAQLEEEIGREREKCDRLEQP